MDPAVERLVARARDGDAGAFERLVARFQRRVFYTVLRIVRDTHRADDLTQEVFITAYRRLADVKEDAAFVPWLLRIARNRAIDAHRRQRREQERLYLVEDWTDVGGTEGGADPTTASTDEAGRAERVADLQAALEEAIASLPQGQRDVLLMSMDPETTHDEIAQTLGIPPGTVKSRLHHARRILTARLRPAMEGA